MKSADLVELTWQQTFLSGDRMQKGRKGGHGDFSGLHV